MAQNLLGPSIDNGFVDKRRALSAKADPNTHVTSALVVGTANAIGTTTTLVTANAAPATNTNMARVGDVFRLFNTSGVLKEETVFRITGIAVAASNTVTFTPAAAVATAVGDFAKLVGLDAIRDEDSLDRALTSFNATSYSASRLSLMTQNDKVYALRLELDKDGI